MDLDNEKESSKVQKLNLLGLTTPNRLIQTFCKRCFKKYFGLFSFASTVLVRRRMLILMALVLSQIVIGCFVVYPVLTSNSQLKREVTDLPKEIGSVTGAPKKSHDRNSISEKVDRTVFVITPTYKRATQKADLTSLSQTLSLVQNLVWIVVEDSEGPSELVSHLLSRITVKTVHLTMETPPELVRRYSKHSWWRWWSWLISSGKPHKGVPQRNAALTWLRNRYRSFSKLGCDGVVYFADDDNRYDVRLFDVMRQTKLLSLWPVGFSGELTYEGPICKNLNQISWRRRKTEMKPRAFPIDMAGFAVNLCEIIHHPYAKFENIVPHGHLENAFILNFISTHQEAECRGSNKEILVWHLRTEEPYLRSESFEPADYELVT